MFLDPPLAALRTASIFLWDYLSSEMHKNRKLIRVAFSAAGGDTGQEKKIFCGKKPGADPDSRSP